ncbi:MAG: hypothetical protein WD035_03435 [Balneolaceae bacterium]
MRFSWVILLLLVVGACSDSSTSNEERETFCTEARYTEQSGFIVSYSEEPGVEGSMIEFNQEFTPSKIYILQLYQCSGLFCVDAFQEAEFDEEGTIINGC